LLLKDYFSPFKQLFFFYSCQSSMCDALTRSSSL
jgi:hypothetical protein